MKEIEVRVFLKHKVHPELNDLLKVNTTATMNVIGPEVILSDLDMTKLQEDIQKVARRAELINRVHDQVKHPWIARDILDGRAAVFNGKLVYMPPFRPKSLREKLEYIVGPLTDEEFKALCVGTTADIKANMMAFGKTADIDTVIKIAAITFEVLKRCS